MWHANDKKSVGRSSPADYEGKRCSAVSYSTGKLGREFRECDLYEPAAHILADVLGLDEADAKGLILGRQSWKEYKNNKALLQS